MGLLVIALGGNALLSPSGAQSFRNEGRSIDRVCRSIALLAKRHRIILTHGNGSQVGDELVRNERAKSFVPKMPLYLLNAETQATIGSMLETSLRNSLDALHVKREVSVVFSHTLVDHNDPAFRKPTKPVGPFYTRRELDAELRVDKFHYIKTGGKYRRVVASPKPKAILELKSIEECSKNGIVIACGGGGIPVVNRDGGIHGVNAVIDKDRATQLLASSLNASRLVILTDIDYVHSGSGHAIMKRIAAKELMGRMSEFEEGTIRPKLEACVGFVENGGRSAAIGNVFKLDSVIRNRSGTRIF
ncbi:MAG: carbamate kinase [Candidatus Micrarchaeaceae archaeon]|jgi:carbamate kinase|nr:carbamate kinase [Candidatus Micrarchaeota archaeon]